MIELKHIEKNYYPNKADTVRVLKGLDLAVQNGEMIAVMGPSGSGKTTLLNIIGCMDSATAGDYMLDGRKIAGIGKKELARTRNAKIGFVLQNFGLLSDRTVADNIMVPLLFSDCPYRKIKKRVDATMEAFEISEYKKRQINQLSGGQKQRVALARAMVNDPEVLLADEPTGSLDAKLLSGVMGMFREQSSRGKTVIVVTHNIEVGQMCDKIYWLRDGLLSQG